MKKICTVLVIIFVSLIPIESKENKDVLYYYQIIDKSKVGGKKFTIFKENNEWKTTSRDGYLFDVIIDFRNGYLLISQHEGAASSFYEIAYYLDNNDGEYLAVNVFHPTHFGDSSTEVFKVYRIKNNSFEDVSDEILPEIKFEMFLKSQKDINSFKKLREKYEEKVEFDKVHYSLPRKGTTIIVKPSDYVLRQTVFHSGYKELSDKVSIIDKISSKKDYKKIKYKWNKQKGKFDLIID